MNKYNKTQTYKYRKKKKLMVTSGEREGEGVR